MRPAAPTTRGAGEELLRPAAAPELVIVEDTREQRPLRFSSRVAVVRSGLPAGDYAPQGFETRAAHRAEEHRRLRPERDP